MSTSEAQKRAHERYNSRNPSIHYRAGELLCDLKARTRWGGSLAETTRRDLGRYYRLMRSEVRTIGLNHGELRTILKACRGMFVSESDVVDGAFIRGRIADYAGAGATLDKLHQLTPAQTYALADLICMYSVQDLPADEFLRRLGYESGEM